MPTIEEKNEEKAVLSSVESSYWSPCWDILLMILIHTHSDLIQFNSLCFVLFGLDLVWFGSVRFGLV
jgi:hypothetical protein